MIRGAEPRNKGRSGTIDCERLPWLFRCRRFEGDARPRFTDQDTSATSRWLWSTRPLARTAWPGQESHRREMRVGSR